MSVVSAERRAALRQELRSGRRLAGCSLDYPTPRLAVDLGRGFDLLFIDCEHGGPGIEAVQALILAARAAGRPAVLRPWSRDLGLARRYLDCGAEGLIWPDLDSAEELDRLDRALVAAGHGDAAVIVLVETKGAVAELDAILAHPRLDGLLVGPGDLAAAHGLPRAARDAGQTALHHDILVRAAAAGVAAGGPVSVLGADLLREAEARLWMHSASGLLADGMARALTTG